MTLRETTAGAELGFVSGIVDVPLTPEQRESGMLGHTPDEWLAYNKQAGGHPLKNNHGAVVGRVVHTYVDDKNRLCASALLDPEYRALWEEVRDGRVHAFSIGFDASRERIGEPYKNNNFEVSLTDNPRKPFATIQVRCSNSAPPLSVDMAESTPTPTPTPVAAPVAAPPAPTAVPEELLQQLAETRKKAELWEAHQRAEKDRLFAEQRQRIKEAEAALRATGMDLDNPGQQALLDELARSEHSTQLLTSLQAMAARLTENERRAAEAQARAEAEAQARAQAEAEAQRNSNVFDRLRRDFGLPTADTGVPAGKRALSADTWNGTAPAELSSTQASLLNLTSLNRAMFESAARTQPAAAAAAMPTAASSSLAAAPAAQPAAVQQIDMPRTPEARAMLAWQLELAGQQMPLAVRCSAGDEPFAGEAVEKLLHNKDIDMHTKQMGVAVSPNMLEFFMRDAAHWEKRSRQAMRDGFITGFHSPQAMPMQSLANPHLAMTGIFDQGVEALSRSLGTSVVPYVRRQRA